MVIDYLLEVMNGTKGAIIRIIAQRENTKKLLEYRTTNWERYYIYNSKELPLKIDVITSSI